METDPRAIRLTGKIIPSPVKTLVNKGMSSIPFVIPVYQGEVYAPFLFLPFLNGRGFYFYILLFYSVFVPLLYIGYLVGN